MLVRVDRVLVRTADDAVHQEVLSAMLVRVAHELDEDFLLHQVDAHRDLRAVVDGRLLRDVLDKAVVRRLEHDVLADRLLVCRMVDHRDVGARVLVEHQDWVEIHVVNEAAACEEHVLLRAVLDEIEVVIEVLEVALAEVFLILRVRQVEQAVVATREIPVLAGTQMVEHGTRLIRQHDADILDAGIHHA